MVPTRCVALACTEVWAKILKYSVADPRYTSEVFNEDIHLASWFVSVCHPAVHFHFNARWTFGFRCSCHPMRLSRLLYTHSPVHARPWTQVDCSTRLHLRGRTFVLPHTWWTRYPHVQVRQSPHTHVMVYRISEHMFDAILITYICISTSQASICRIS